MSPHQNIVVFFADQVRSDAFRCLGNRQVHTPNIDWIGGGTRLRRHVTPNQICQPSRAVFFTGLYPRHNLVHRNGTALPEGLATLPSLLSEAGYSTYASGKLHFQPLMAAANINMPESLAFWYEAGSPVPEYRFEQYEAGIRPLPARAAQLRAEAAAWHGPYHGFEHVDLVLGESLDVVHAGHYAHWLAQNCPDVAKLYDPDAALSPPPADLWEVWKSAVPPEQHYDMWIADRCCDFLDRYGADRPFFAFISFPDPHHPFSAPQPYCDRHDPMDMPKPRVVPGELDRMPAYLRALAPSSEQGALLHTTNISERTLSLAIAHTYGAVELIDDAVGRVLSALRRHELLDDTLVVFSADHGELLGDHGLLRKGPPPYRQLIEIPFLARGPGVAADRDVWALTSHLDAMATLLAWSDIPVPESDGTSVLSLLRGEEGRIHEAVFGEYHPVHDPKLYNRTITTESWRFTRYAGGEDEGELFDHRADPDEHWNLYGESRLADVVHYLSSKLDAALPAQPTVSSIIYGKY
jgi:arylsulfatase A-like enzyme